MDIACPQCATAYELDDATIGPAGRKVRCSACGEVWRVSREDAPAAETAATGEPTGWDAEASENAAAAEPASAEPPQPEPVPKTRWIKDSGRDGAKTSAWRSIADWRVGAVAATVLVLAGGLHQRERVVRFLPQTAKLYAAVGLPVNLRGIEIRNVKSRVIDDNDERVLVIDGDLVNVADRRVDVPRLHFALLGPDGRQIYVWSAQADRTVLQAGETLNFRRRLAAPPGEAKDVSVRFVTRSDITAGIK